MEMTDQQAFDMIMGLGAGVILAIVAVYFIIRALFLYSMFKVLKNCGEYARIPAGLVWIALIPLVDIIMFIIFAIMIPDSINKKFQAHGAVDPDNGGKTIGLVFAISYACQLVPLVNLVSWIVAIVTWIMYWVKLSGYNSSLPQLQAAAVQPEPVQGGAV